MTESEKPPQGIMVEAVSRTEYSFGSPSVVLTECRAYNNEKEGFYIGPPDWQIGVVSFHADGVNDDTAYIQARIDGRVMGRMDGKPDDQSPGDYLVRVPYRTDGQTV